MLVIPFQRTVAKTNLALHRKHTSASTAPIAGLLCLPSSEVVITTLVDSASGLRNFKPGAPSSPEVPINSEVAIGLTNRRSEGPRYISVIITRQQHRTSQGIEIEGKVTHASNIGENDKVGPCRD
jgi:hypothetical protein